MPAMVLAAALNTTSCGNSAELIKDKTLVPAISLGAVLGYGLITVLDHKKDYGDNNRNDYSDDELLK